MKLVYCASPYRAANSVDQMRNVEYTNVIFEYVRKNHHVPIIPHRYFPMFLNEEDERQEGMLMAEAVLKGCNEMWMFTDYGVSEGMKGEVEFALKNSIRVRNIKLMEA